MKKVLVVVSGGLNKYAYRLHQINWDISQFANICDSNILHQTGLHWMRKALVS